MARRPDKATKVGQAVLKESINGSDTDETVRSGDEDPIVGIDDIVCAHRSRRLGASLRDHRRVDLVSSGRGRDHELVADRDQRRAQDPTEHVARTRAVRTVVPDDKQGAVGARSHAEARKAATATA